MATTKEDRDLMQLVFTSFKDSQSMDGFKVSIDKHTPKLCSYPTITYMIVPTASKSLTRDNMERICESIMDNNWLLIQDFVTELYEEHGVRKIVFCDWATSEQIAHGKICMAKSIGQYIEREVLNNEFEFPVEIIYGDGRETL